MIESVHKTEHENPNLNQTKMKNLKKNLLAVLAFVFAFGAAFANVSNFRAEVSIFREIPSGGGVMENLTDRCTITKPGALCSNAYPSVNGVYWFDAAKTTPTGGLPSSSVYLDLP